jgi:hypothetical protein
MGKKRKANDAGFDDHPVYFPRFNKQFPLCPVPVDEPIELTDKCRHYSTADEVPRHLRK